MNRHVEIRSALRQILGDVNVAFFTCPIQRISPIIAPMQYVSTFSAEVSPSLSVLVQFGSDMVQVLHEIETALICSQR